MQPSERTAYERYRPWRRWVEIGFFAAVLVVNATGSLVVPPTYTGETTRSSMRHAASTVCSRMAARSPSKS